MTSEYPQDGGSVCCCYDYRVDKRLKNMCGALCLASSWVHISNAGHTERYCPQDGDHGKKADGLYSFFVT